MEPEIKNSIHEFSLNGVSIGVPQEERFDPRTIRGDRSGMAPEWAFIDLPMETIMPHDIDRAQKYSNAPTFSELIEETRKRMQINIPTENKMNHEKIMIKIVNNGFFVEVGCQSFVFGTEKELFQAISDYKKDPEKAREKYCGK